ncbi:phytochrome-like protein cph2 [Sphingomonas dokdonensis]|uniref:Phytochrome-like protein cph2 n=1 Tax=Sphingomonas dokdonensis TaxID=344880 RepID=A0A245ZFC9_9SPHN|nr:phytochrome-like protein cph2 [Sphingomonas dokdonensis]
MRCAGLSVIVALLLVAIVALVVMAAAYCRLWLHLAAIRRRIVALPGDGAARTAEGALDEIERQVVQLRPRLLTQHPITALPTREALLARMSADKNGVVGALAFTDFDRLTAIDPVIAERMLAICAARLRQMLPPTRLAAQIDRGHIGMWYGDGDAATAQAELTAIAYALGQEIDSGAGKLTPKVAVRLEPFDAAEARSAGTLLSQLVASFTLPAGAAGAPSTSDDAALARDHYAIEQDLRQAIVQQELSLAFQPLIDAGRQIVCGAEALLRWDHPVRGRISPALFVPVMETAGMAREIGNWALNAATREAGRWRASGLPPLRIAINVSGHQLEEDDLPALVRRTLHHHNVPAEAIELELTESVATTDTEHCRRLFEALRATGIKLAVDDFGTGYSGFSSLRRLAFDKIKIDREFVTDVDRRRDSQAICQSVIALGAGLGIRVLAEGVERYGEYAWLRRNGCHHFQGFYFAPPLTGDAFTAFVRDTDGLRHLLHPATAPLPVHERVCP